MNDLNGASQFAAAFADKASMAKPDYFLDLDKALEACGTKIVRAKPNKSSSPATYVAFTYQPSIGLEDGERGKTHTNTIYIQHTKQGRERNAAEIQVSKWHESFHAIQDHIPEMFASPYNEATDVVMSIEDWVWRMVMTEGDSYAKTALFGYLAAEDNPEIREAMKSAPVTVEDFENFYAQSGSIERALELSSTHWWDKIRCKIDDDEPDLTLLDHYIGFALESYNLSRLKPGHESRPEEFVRLNREKVADAIAESFGPRTFSHAQIQNNFCYMPPMADHLKEKMENIRQAIGQPERLSLRNFDEALLARGMTGVDLAEKSKRNVSWYVAGVGKVPLNQAIEQPKEEGQDFSPALT